MNGHRPVSALLLDLDDTLVDTGAAMLVAAMAGFAAVCPDVAEELHRSAAERFCEDPGGHLRRYTSGEITFADMRAARFREVVLGMGIDTCCAPQDAGLVESGHHVFEDSYGRAMRAATRAFPDAVPLLEGARRRGLPTAVVTNSSDVATRMKLEAAGIDGLVDVVMTTDTLGVGKPDPRVFHHACDAVGVPPAQAAYVGDDLDTDAVGARNAGLVSYWLVREGALGAAPPGIAAVGSLADVLVAVLPDLGLSHGAR